MPAIFPQWFKPIFSLFFEAIFTLEQRASLRYLLICLILIWVSNANILCSYPQKDDRWKRDKFERWSPLSTEDFIDGNWPLRAMRESPKLDDQVKGPASACLCASFFWPDSKSHFPAGWFILIEYLRAPSVSGMQVFHGKRYRRWVTRAGGEHLTKFSRGNRPGRGAFRAAAKGTSPVRTEINMGSVEWEKW